MRRNPAFLCIRKVRRGAAMALAAGVGLASLLPFAAPASATSPGDSPSDSNASQSLLGNYLAGRIARGLSDTSGAAKLYSGALARDPGNEQLLERSFEMEATEGNWERAVPLAEALSKAQPTNRMARMFMSLVEFKRGHLAEAEEHIKAASANPIGELTSTLVRAWYRQAEGRSQEALDLLEAPRMPDWAQVFLRYHKALLADVAFRKPDARSAYERLYKGDQRTLRVAMAFAQHAANSGDLALAKTILQQHLDRTKSEGHPMARALLAKSEAGERSDLLIKTPNEGLAEIFYGLGEVLSGEGGIGPGAMFIQYALYLEPKFPFALATLANIFESTKRYDSAITTYDRIEKGTPLDSSIEIRKAINLNQLERVDEAKTLLEDIAKREPQDLKPLDALGTIMRGHKRFDEAITYYTRAIAMIKKPDVRHWGYYYARGTSYERVKQWGPAEADLQTALKLSPDQPLILNYLGYSWVDQGKNLKQGMTLIEKAVKLKPDDGYIVDSLGWAHFRQGNFKEAARWLERAVELRPEDPVLNDHLGDALWRVGREREARYQWEQSLTLKPEPEDAEKIKGKLTKGLPQQARAQPVRPTKQVQSRADIRKRAETRAPASPIP